MNITLVMTPAEAEALCDALVETAIQMDDDGNEGSFAVSALAPILKQLRAKLGA